MCFTAIGEVSLVSIKIENSLCCDHASFNAEAALKCNGMVVKSNVLFINEFRANGRVSLSGAQIGGKFECKRAIFNNQNKTSLQTDGMTVSGAFDFRDSHANDSVISLASAKIGRLIDDKESWTNTELILDGFVYDRLTGSHTFTDAKSRINWLKKQSPAHLGSDGYGKEFKPQPWLQLQKTFRETGHFEAARQVGIAFEQQLRQANLIGQTPEDWCKPRKWLTRRSSRFFHWLFGWLIGYGYRPLRLFFYMIAIWLICGFIYWGAAVYGNNGNGVFAPSNPLVFQNPEYAVCVPDSNEAKAEKSKSVCTTLPAIQGAGNWYLCAKLREEYTGFSPFAYSLDLILPLVDLQQEHDWAPMIPTPQNNWFDELTAFSLKHVTRLVVWFEILFGWIASLLLVAVVSGLTKRREE